MDVTALLRRHRQAPSLSERPGESSDAVTASDCGACGDWSRLDDVELLRHVARQNRTAAAVLINRHQAMVRAFLQRITGRNDLADDLAQETFLRMLRYADRYDARYPMKTWLFTIARRLLINHLRKHGGAVAEATDQQRDTGPQPDEGLVQQDYRRWLREQLQAALMQLTAPQRQVVVLFYQQQCTIDQIAQTMQMPANTIKSHLHRARAALRQLLDSQWEMLRP